MSKGFGKLRWTIVSVVASTLLLLLITSLFSVQDFLYEIGFSEPIGAFFAGMLFVSSFTFVIGTFFIVALADGMPIWQLVLIAGAGSSFVDIVLFHLVRHTVFEEVKPLMRKWRRRHFMRILHSRYVSWTIPVLGALVIILPLPDELGVSMMGISSLDTRRFAILSFVLNCVGVFIVAITSRAIS